MAEKNKLEEHVAFVQLRMVEKWSRTSVSDVEEEESKLLFFVVIVLTLFVSEIFLW